MKPNFKLVSVLFLVLSWPVAAASLNGFNIENALIIGTDIRAGGPPRDGIPAISNPVYESAAQANWLNGDDWVIGLNIANQSIAFPIRIMNWHEIVNTELSGQPIVVTFCPLCGTGMVFEAEAGGKKLDFGVSGLLYQSDVLLYDRETESLWSQLMMKAVSGTHKGTSLTLLSSEHTTWQQWKSLYPDTLVLSKDTGFRRNYDRNPYAGYETSGRLMFPVNNDFPMKYHPKDQVLGVVHQSEAMAILYRELSVSNAAEQSFVWQGKNWTVEWQPEVPVARLRNDEGEIVPGTRAFVFAWFAFNPDSLIYTGPGNY